MVWPKKKKVEEPLVVETKKTEEGSVVKKSEVEDRYSVGTIATQTSEVIIDNASEEQLDLQAVLVLILNKLDKLENLLE
ncbi:MAG TPA: hypothetical protein PLT65_04400 [Bacilli bacterium]|nr:hypothetical protein [Bacilli bacterium]